MLVLGALLWHWTLAVRPSGRDDEVLEHQAEDFVEDVGGTKCWEMLVLVMQSPGFFWIFLLKLVFCINFRENLEMIFENFRELWTILRCDQVKRIMQHSHVVLARFCECSTLFELHCFNGSRQISAMKLRRLVGLEELLPNSEVGWCTLRTASSKKQVIAIF